MPVSNGKTRRTLKSKNLMPERSFLKDHAYNSIKRNLLNEEYPPGSFLSERQLAASLGMSKTPVKAALEKLETEGFISVSPQQGIVVREMSVREIADQYEIRAALESFALQSIAGKLETNQITRVQLNLEAQARLIKNGNMDQGMELDSEFHKQFLDFLGNNEILKVFLQLREKMQRVISQVFRMCPSRFESSFKEHQAIADAVIQGNGGRAAELVIEHLELGKRLILSPRG